MTWLVAFAGIVIGATLMWLAVLGGGNPCGGVLFP
jgi:hypothetical protein